MIAERYHLLAQLGAGPDGVAYRANDRTSGEDVEVRVLAAARAEAERWPGVVKRLRLVRLLAHPVALAVRDLQLDDAEPYAVLEMTPEHSLAERLQASLLPPLDEVLTWAEPLAGVLADAYRIGLTLGKVTLAGIRLTVDGTLKIDFTALDMGQEGALEDSTSAALDRSCRAPEPTCDAAADVHGLVRR